MSSNGCSVEQIADLLDLAIDKVKMILQAEKNRSEKELKTNPQMRKLLRNYEAHESEIGFDLDLVKRTLDSKIIHDTVLRNMTEQGIPGWAKRFFIKGGLMELVRIYATQSDDE